MKAVANPIRSSVRAAIIGGWMAAVVFWEIRHALRPVHESKLRRDVRNLEVAAAAGMVMQFCEAPVAFSLARFLQRKRRGLLPCLPLPDAIRPIAGMLMLDWTLYWWHVLTHRVPFLWRFHQVHHLDREMDASTALRFHFGEIAISVLFRAAQVAVIGLSAEAVAWWQVFLFVCILFHHSNARLPLAWERRIGRLLVTPRLHGIHHSIAADEVNSNWSSGLAVWDWLHGTLRTAVPQESITIGVPGYGTDDCQRIGAVLTLPFREAGQPLPASRRSIRESLDALQP